MIPKWERGIIIGNFMRIISKKVLRDFGDKHVQALPSIEAWYADVKEAQWRNPQAIKAEYANASFLMDNRVVFNIKGNSYRIVVKINYDYQIVYIRFIGTHKEYDKINANTI